MMCSRRCRGYEEISDTSEINSSQAKPTVHDSTKSPNLISSSINMAAASPSKEGNLPRSSTKSPSLGSESFSDLGGRASSISDLSESFTELENYTSQVLSDYENESTGTTATEYKSSNNSVPTPQPRRWLKVPGPACCGDTGGEEAWRPRAPEEAKNQQVESVESDSVENLISLTTDDTDKTKVHDAVLDTKNDAESLPELIRVHRAETAQAEDKNEKNGMFEKSEASCKEGAFEKMIRKSMFLYHWSAASESLCQDSFYTAQDHACEALKLLDVIESRGETCPAFIDFQDKDDYDATYDCDDWETNSEDSLDDDGGMSSMFHARFDLQSIRYHSFFGQDQFNLAMGVLEELQHAIDSYGAAAEDRDRAYVHGWRAACLKQLLDEKMEYDSDEEDSESDESGDSDTKDSRESDEDDEEDEVCEELAALYSQAEASCSKAISLLGEAYGGYYPIPRVDKHHTSFRFNPGRVKKDNKTTLWLYQHAFESFLTDMIEIQELWNDEGKEGYYRWLLEDFKSAKEIAEKKKAETKEKPSDKSTEKTKKKQQPTAGAYIAIQQESFYTRISSPTNILGLQLFIAFAVPAVLIVSGGWVIDRLVG